ncbi:MAG: T9SS type A sorting domain-containing protein [Marinilabiliaceae bacterium]|nr:T9SS type A sorting domain-containing protein [Marinilabiliaceae bacterium]
MHINLIGEADLQGTICIINTEGKIVMEQQITDNKSVLINPSQLQKGIYLCCFYNGKEKVSILQFL